MREEQVVKSTLQVASRVLASWKELRSAAKKLLDVCEGTVSAARSTSTAYIYL